MAVDPLTVPGGLVELKTGGPAGECEVCEELDGAAAWAVPKSGGRPSIVMGPRTLIRKGATSGGPALVSRSTSILRLAAVWRRGRRVSPSWTGEARSASTVRVQLPEAALPSPMTVPPLHGAMPWGLTVLT